MISYKILVVLLMLTMYTKNAFSQQGNTPKVVLKAGYSGMFFAGTDGKAGYTNFGGPGIKINYKHVTVSINMLPSLRFAEDKPRPFVTPVLGAGLMIGYKSIIVGLPFYYSASQLKWKIAPGIGVKIGK